MRKDPQSEPSEGDEGHDEKKTDRDEKKTDRDEKKTGRARASVETEDLPSCVKALSILHKAGILSEEEFHSKLSMLSEDITL